MLLVRRAVQTAVRTNLCRSFSVSRTELQERKVSGDVTRLTCNCHSRGSWIGVFFYCGINQDLCEPCSCLIRLSTTSGAVSVCLQGLVLGVFEKEGGENGVHLTEAAAGFDQSVSGKLSELLEM